MGSSADTVPNCWKVIGVWGRQRPRCPVLEEVVHCRNCEVFIQAGRGLLERELTPDYMRQWTRVLAAEKEEELVGTLSLLIFRIGAEWLALPALLFAEVIEPGPLHTVPHRDNPVLLGVVNVHGEVQLCVSLQALLGIEEAASERRAQQRMLVMEDRGQRWVFPVDEIDGVHRVHPGALEAPPGTAKKHGIGFTRNLFRWKDEYVAYLDDELLLHKLARSVK